LRVGIGWDRHLLSEGRKLFLGGVEIPFDKGSLGHSDADVLVHSVIDAIFGAAGLPDIGMHFPDSDEKYKDIRSTLLLQKTVDLIKNKYKIVNVDSVIILKKPKMSEYIEEIKQTLSPIIGTENLNIKAKSGNGIGPEYEGKCITCYCVVMLDEIS